MAIVPFLAMTATEMYAASSLPPKIAWMACHFSPYGLGLSNLPRRLPADSLLIVDDITPPHGHDATLIAEQLSRCLESFRCFGILLDFQRSGCAETRSIAEYLTTSLSCPIGVSECYAAELDCSVFLPPLPPSVTLQEYLVPWTDRRIWLELGMEGEIITLSEKGAESLPVPYPNLDLKGFADEALHCHYQIETNEKSARFTLWRTKEDLALLLEQAEVLGVAEIVGLYQEIVTSGLRPSSQ